MKKLLTALLVLALAALAMGAMAEINVTVGYELALQSLNPWLTTDSVYNAICPYIYTTLGWVEVTGQPAANYMIKNIEQVGELDYKIELYDNITDSAGNKIDAYDVQWSYESCIAAGNVNKARGVSKCEATGEYTLDFSIANNAPGTLDGALAQVYVVDKEAYEASSDQFATTAIGAGPYVIKSFVPGSTIVLEKRADFWADVETMPNNLVPNADVITGKFITDQTQMSIALEEGSIDMAANISGMEASRFEQMKGFHVESRNTFSCWTVFFNMLEGSPFADNQALREAVAYAINSKYVVAGGVNGYGTVANGFGAKGVGDWNPEWDEWDYFNADMEKAKAKLKEAGYKEGQLTLRLVGQWESAKPACEVIQANLNAIGINVDIQCPDSALFSSYIEADAGAYDLVFMFYNANNGVAGLFDYCLNLNKRTSDYLFFGLNDPELQNLVNACTDVNKTTQADVDAVQQYLKDNALLYAVYFPSKYYVYRDTITGTKVQQGLSLLAGSSTFAPDFVGVASK